MVSSGASSSSRLHTHLPPGLTPDGFNITVVAYVSDNLGATAATSLGVDGVPLAFVSTLPDQVCFHSRRSHETTIPSNRAGANRTCLDHRIV